MVLRCIDAIVGSVTQGNGALPGPAGEHEQVHIHMPAARCVRRSPHRGDDDFLRLQLGLRKGIVDVREAIKLTLHANHSIQPTASGPQRADEGN